jgi:hypothetical protein
MPAYEAAEFDPPAPVARSLVAGPSGTCPDVPLLIDSGADVSVIPQWAADEVGAELVHAGVILRFFDGSEESCDVAHLRVQFLRFTFEGAFVVTDGSHGILGRNILNRLALTLDGPRQLWTV